MTRGDEHEVRRASASAFASAFASSPLVPPSRFGSVRFRPFSLVGGEAPRPGLLSRLLHSDDDLRDNFAGGVRARMEAAGFGSVRAVSETRTLLGRVTHYEAKGEKVVVATADGLVEANYLLIGCNGYLGRLDKEAEKYQMPINNFILATEPLGAERASQINRDNLAIVDTRFVVNYWHNSPDHRLIFGGGENYSSRFPRDIAQFVRKYMLEVYPNLKDVNIEYGWGGTLAITMRRMPHFGRKAHNIYWAQGYSGHGIHMATMGGKMAADAIMGQAERFDLFASLKHYPFPGGRWLRWPGLVAGMLYYSLLDHL